jgi:hypothetical protein
MQTKKEGIDKILLHIARCATRSEESKAYIVSKRCIGYCYKHPPANRAKHTLFKPMYWILLNIHQCGSSRCIIKLMKIFLSRRWSKEGNKNHFYKHSTSEV